MATAVALLYLTAFALLVLGALGWVAPRQAFGLGAAAALLAYSLPAISAGL